MSFSSPKKAIDLYRQDEKAGGKLLSADERQRLINPYLPSAPSQSPDRNSRTARPFTFGIRRFVKSQLHLLVYTVIHTVFSIYIHTRQGYHAIRDRVISIFYYHHRDPAMIQKDVKRLDKLPKHLAVILKVEDGGKGGELDRHLSEIGEISAWCASAGIPVLTVYEKTGILKHYLPQTHRAISQNLKSYFGRVHPTVTLCAPHVQSIESPAPSTPLQFSGGISGHLLVRLISAEDGRDSIVDLTKTLAEMAQRSKISPTDVCSDLIDAELTESVMPESDLLIIFGPYVEFQGYPPWHLNLTEVHHEPDNDGVGYQVFFKGLCKFANAQFRWGT